MRFSFAWNKTAVELEQKVIEIVGEDDHFLQQCIRNIWLLYCVSKFLTDAGVKTDFQRKRDDYIWMQPFNLGVIDIEVEMWGKIGCLMVNPGEHFCHIPPEFGSGRVAYIVVDLDPLSTVTLVGFALVDADNPPEQLRVENLQLIEELPNYLRQHNCTVVVNLWQNILEAGWQTFEELVSQKPQLSLCFRGIPTEYANQVLVKRAKLINLGIDAHQVALIVSIAQSTDEQVNIQLQLHPVQQTTLPTGLNLIVLDQVEQTLRRTQALPADNWLQLEFSGETGDCFSVQVALGLECFAENFVI